MKGYLGGLSQIESLVDGEIDRVQFEIDKREQLEEEPQ
jgi:hypothetical protein